MLKLQPNPTFNAEVDMPVPGGVVEKITMTFRHKDTEQLAAYMAALAEKSDAENILEIVSGWQGIDMPFDEAAVKVLLKNYHGAALPIYRKYIDELNKARLGN